MTSPGARSERGSREELAEERREFESRTVDDLMPAEFSGWYLFKLDEDGYYERDFVEERWRGWRCAMAYAALRSPPPSAVREMALREAAEVVHARFNRMSFPEYADAPDPPELIDAILALADKAPDGADPEGVLFEQWTRGPSLDEESLINQIGLMFFDARKTDFVAADYAKSVIAMVRRNDAVAPSTSATHNMPGERDGRRRFKHLKRGTTYVEIGRGELQASTNPGEGEQMVAYRSEHDGRVWFRPAMEFDDGRFVGLPPEPVPSAIDEAVRAEREACAKMLEEKASVLREQLGKRDRPANDLVYNRAIELETAADLIRSRATAAKPEEGSK